jgi:hypothetical protein
MSVENAQAETWRVGVKKPIPHPRFGDVEGLLAGIESALATDRNASGASLVELFYLSEMDRYGMVNAAKYVDDPHGYPLKNFQYEITRCVNAVRSRLEKEDIPENWHEELLEHLGIEKGKP